MDIYYALTTHEQFYPYTIANKEGKNVFHNRNNLLNLLAIRGINICEKNFVKFFLKSQVIGRVIP